MRTKLIATFALTFSVAVLLAFFYPANRKDSSLNVTDQYSQSTTTLKVDKREADIALTNLSDENIFDEIELPEHVKMNPAFRKKVAALKRSIEANNTPSGELSSDQFDIAMELAKTSEAKSNLARMRMKKEFNDYFYRQDFASEIDKVNAARELTSLLNKPDMKTALTPGEAFEAQRSILESLPLNSDFREELGLNLVESKIQPALERKYNHPKVFQSPQYTNRETYDFAKTDVTREQELQIIDEVLKMKVIPNNMTHQEYLNFRMMKLHKERL